MTTGAPPPSRVVGRFGSAAAKTWTVFRRYPMTSWVTMVTAVVGAAQLLDGRVVADLQRNRQLRFDGQWWRLVTPMFVQPSGIGQYAFNLLPVRTVLRRLPHRTRSRRYRHLDPGRRADHRGRHHHAPPRTESWLRNLVCGIIVSCAVALTALHDDHGAGLLSGLVIARLLRPTQNPLRPGTESARD